MSVKLEHYIISKTLGVGAFGKVKRKIVSLSEKLQNLVAKHEISNTEVAIKIINKKKVRSSKMSAKVF